MIPTAEEFIETKDPNGEMLSFEFCRDSMIEFAKLHVREALEEAACKAVAKENPADFGTGEIWVDKKSILNAYPETLIK
jgi:hypothetical protein